MTKKRRRTTKTLTWGWSQADERPRPGGKGDPEILVQVKLSKRELMHSLGMSCTHSRVPSVSSKHLLKDQLENITHVWFLK